MYLTYLLIDVGVPKSFTA